MNTAKAIEILGIPSECEIFEGQIRQEIRNTITVVTVYDFTSGKLIKSTRVEYGKETKLHGEYVLNKIANNLDHYGLEITSFQDRVLKMFKPLSWNEVEQGPFQGYTYWYPWQKVTVNEASFTLEYCPWMNTDAMGYPEPTMGVDPKTAAGRVYKRDVSITKTSTGTTRYTYGKKSAYTGRKSELMSLTGMTEDQIAYATRYEYPIVKVDNTMFITSLAMDIEVNGAKCKGVFYVNGEPADTLNLSALTTSFGMPCPSYLFRWILINEVPTAITAYGESKLIPFNAGQNNTINVQQGAYDTTDGSTLVYNPDLPQEASLIAMAEFYPAQGKNENAARRISLETGIELNW